MCITEGILQTDISFSCICHVTDPKFCHNIAKVALDPRDNSQVDPQTTLMKFMINNWTDTWKTDVNLLFTISNCQMWT